MRRFICEIKTKGDIIILFKHEKVPMTVANFIGLAEGKIQNDKITNELYDGLSFIGLLLTL